ncbi:MAG: M4 family metallopeptidase [Myxococcota bacterium]
MKGLLLLGSVSACAEPLILETEIDERVDLEPLEAQVDASAIEALRIAHPEMEVAAFDQRAGTLVVRGQLHGPDSRSPEVVADETLDEFSVLWGATDRVALSRSESKTGLRSKVTHVRYEQRVADVPVYQGEVVVHVREDGRVASLQGQAHRVDNGESFDPKPAIGREKLESLVRDHFAVEGDFLEYTDPELFALVDDGEANLVWSLSVLAEDFPGSADLLVDARTGEVRREDFIADHLTGTGCDPFGNNLLINPTKPLGAQYQLHDKTRPGKIRGYDQGGSFTWTQSAPLTDTDNDWCAPAQEEAVLGHDNMGKVLDFFDSRYGRSSYNGSGGNIKMGFDASFNFGGPSAVQWNATSIGNGRFKFGGGAAGEVWMPLDVVGHEFTHAMLHAEGLDTTSDEGAAFHEHGADVFGTLVEFDFGNASGQENFLMGEEVNGVTPIRDLLSPPTGRDHYSEFDTTGNAQHANSQILSLPFAMLAGNAGTHPHSNVIVPSIGMSDVRDLYYETITNYLSPGPVSFGELGAGLADAAGDMFGDSSDEKFGVEVAYLAAGITPSSLSLIPYVGNFDTWESGSTAVTYGSAQSSPGAGNTSAKMEDGKLWDGSMFGMTPAAGFFGRVMGSFDLQLPANIPLGGSVLAPHILAEVGFPLIAVDTDEALVNLVIKDSAGTVLTNSSRTIRRDDDTVDVIDMDLEAFAGQAITLEVYVYNTGPVPTRPVMFDTLSMIQLVQ